MAGWLAGLVNPVDSESNFNWTKSNSQVDWLAAGWVGWLTGWLRLSNFIPFSNEIAIEINQILSASQPAERLSAVGWLAGWLAGRLAG